jgi:hypothetical protein
VERMQDLKSTCIRLLLAFLVFQFTLIGQVQAKSKRHMVIYGGLSAADLYPLAQNIDILVLNHISQKYLRQLKTLNPDLILLQYHHAPGFHKHYPQWKFVNQNEDWFVHDRASGKRLVEKKYGWFLMNNANENWREFIVKKIVENTPDIFDGIFIDDFWNRYIHKFHPQGTQSKAWPREEIINDWVDNMVLLIERIRQRYPKLIYINGAYREYIQHVDGCMEEGFVHPNWKPDSYQPDPLRYKQTLLKIEALKKYGKTLLIQSGTTEMRPNTRKIYDFCRASYLLIENENTSFGFHPLHTYKYIGIPFFDNAKMNIGIPLGKFYSVQKPRPAPNLVPNADFSNGLRHWHVLLGSPQPSADQTLNKSAILFKSRSGNTDRIRSAFIPVKADTKYRLAVICKSEMNRAGSARYKKLGLQGRFYDSQKRKLPGAFDLQFDTGAYSWRPFETTYTSPAGAAYFRMRLGFIGDGTGKGWVDKVYFGMASESGQVLGREFSGGNVFVNYGTAETTINYTSIENQSGSASLTLMPAEGRIILQRK